MHMLGIMTLNPKLELAYFTKIAKDSPRYHLRVSLFHPKDWDSSTSLITGVTFNHTNETWEYNHFPLPTFIYDRCFHSKRTLESNIFQTIQHLKKKTLFLSIGLPNKWRVYTALKKHKLLATYLPETKRLTTSVVAIHLLLTKKSLVLKPEHGSQGKGILFISYKEDIISMQTHRHGKIYIAKLSLSELITLLNHFLAHKNYIVQPLLSLTNERNEPFDVRILMQKDANGVWQEISRGLKVGLQGSLVSNLHNGGTVKAFDTWMKQQSVQRQMKIDKQLNDFVYFLPPILEAKFGRLFELGIDIGIDKNGQCWLLEVNSKPGYQLIKKTNLLAAKQLHLNVLSYCDYLKTSLLKGDVST